MGSNERNFTLVFLLSSFCSIGCSSPATPQKTMPDGSISLPDAGPDEPAPATDGALEACPRAGDPIEAKIVGYEYFSADPIRVSRVSVWLSKAAAQTEKLCKDESPCMDDDQLLALYDANFSALHCVISALGTDIRNLTPTWFEVPQHASNGQPVPFLRAFRANIEIEHMRKLSGHPFVERIEPAPAFGGPTGVFPDPPEGCPSDSEEPDAKLEKAQALQGKPRQPAVVELRDNGVLPTVPVCASDTSGELCEVAVFAYWDRAVLNLREQTCVYRRLDQVVRTTTPAVSYSSGGGDWRPPPLPPLGTASGFALKSFGFALTWDEAREIAKHPYVESIWTAPSLQFVNTQTGCPPDLRAPIVTPDCPSDMTSIDEKITPSDRAILSAVSGPQNVIVTVKGGAVVCQLERCSVNPCATNDAVTKYWIDQNLASQRCIRDLIRTLGATAAPDAFWLVNAFSATLDWSQIQAVAAHPHVTRIEPGSGGGTAGP